VGNVRCGESEDFKGMKGAVGKIQSSGEESYEGLAKPHTLFCRQRQHARMPLLVLGMAIAEPPAALRAMHCRWIIAWLVVGRNCLTQALRVLAVHFFSPIDTWYRDPTTFV
jgi:hypothetical protein